MLVKFKHFRKFCKLWAVALSFNFAANAQNDFKIGFYNWQIDCTDSAGQCYHQNTINGLPSSTINVLAHNGANIIGTYLNLWHSAADIDDCIALSKNNGCEFMFSAFPSVSYLPKFTNKDGELVYTGKGRVYYKNPINLPYTVSPGHNGTVYHDAEYIFSKSVASNPNVWAIRVIDEPNFNHLKWTRNKYSAKAPYCTETPPEKVDSFYTIYSDLKDKYNSNVKIAITLALHGRGINNNSNDLENDNAGCPFTDRIIVNEKLQNDIYNSETGTWIEQDYDPQDYLYFLNKYSNNIIFEGSYGAPNHTYANRDYDRIENGENHFLGFLKSIDYFIRQDAEVHKIIDLGRSNEPYYKNTANNYDDMPGQFRIYNGSLVENGSWLWFQAYASIIHGAKGIWFYSLGWNQNLDGKMNFNESYVPEEFPVLYKKFTANLTKELAYLNNNGFLNNENILAQKQDTEVENSLIPPYNEYLSGVNKDFVDARYGLRYTLRHNDTSAVLIIANPTPFALHDIEVNLDNISNPLLNDLNSFEILFSKENQEVEGVNYKTDRTGFLGKLPLKYNVEDDCEIKQRKFLLSFTAFDTHVVLLTKVPENKDSLNFYPNPFTGAITISSPSKFKSIQSISFYNLDGKSVFSYSEFNQSSHISFDFTNQKGVFIAHIRYKNGCTKSKKLILVK
jgi:hypothetical protein